MNSFPRASASFCALLLALGLAHTPAASAFSIAPDPVLVHTPAVTVTVDFLLDTIGIPGGGVLLAGSVDPTDVTLVFTLETSEFVSGSDFLLVVAGSPVVGAGTIPGGGPDLTSGVVGGAGGAGGVVLGATPAGVPTDAFFVSFDSLTPGALVEFATFGGVVFFTGSAVVVPEPSIPTLLAGLLLLVVGGARRDR